MTRILLVEDEIALSDPLSFLLEREGYEVEVAADGPSAITAFDRTEPDLMLLDLMLPGLPGTEVCREIRSRSTVPIIMLTAKDSEIDIVVGLELGADDYVTKPFSNRELLARVRAVLRRTEGKRASRRGEKVRAYRFAGWELNTGTRKLRAPDSRNVELTNSEYALLVAFLKSPQRILTRDQLLESSRLHDDIYDRSIDVQILRLRRKIEESPNQPTLIRTERGAGYYLDSPVETV